MGWDSKRYYSVNALGRVTVKATDSQKARWAAAAKRHGRGTAGAFLAWAGDVAIVALDAYTRVSAELQEELDR